MPLEANIGQLDRILRFALGAVMLSLLFIAPESRYWGLLGLIPLATAVFRVCPAYSLLGVKTVRRSHSSSKP